MVTTTTNSVENGNYSEHTIYDIHSMLKHHFKS